MDLLHHPRGAGVLAHGSALMEPDLDIFGVGQVGYDGEVGTASIGVGARQSTVILGNAYSLIEMRLPRVARSNSSHKAFKRAASVATTR